MLEVAGQAKVGCTSAGAASPFGASGICSLDDSFVPVPVRGPASLCTWDSGSRGRALGRYCEATLDVEPDTSTVKCNCLS